MRPVLLASLLLAFATAARATVLEVPVPALLGTYTTVDNVSYQRTVALHLPVIPSAIHQVSLRVRGTARSASYVCDGSGVISSVNIGASLFENNLHNAHEWLEFDGFLGGSGAFGYTRIFDYRPGPPDYSFLLDGTANLKLIAWDGAPGPECVSVGLPDLTQFDEVTLLIDGDFPTAAATSSWGRLKAIYR